MGWKYRIRKRADGMFDVVEYFPPRSWTADGMTDSRESKAELLKMLQDMLADCRGSNVFDETKMLKKTKRKP